MTIFCRIIVKGIVSSQILASFSSWLLSKFCLGVKIVVCKSVWVATFSLYGCFASYDEFQLQVVTSFALSHALKAALFYSKRLVICVMAAVYLECLVRRSMTPFSGIIVPSRSRHRSYRIIPLKVLLVPLSTQDPARKSAEHLCDKLKNIDIYLQ